MLTTIYIARHSESLKTANYANSDDLQTINEKLVLTVDGEKKAEKLSMYKELQDVGVVISSNYARAVATAKYVAKNNKLDNIINENYGERKFGVNSWDEIDEDFYERQYNDENYKTLRGESQKEVKERMYNALIETIEKYKGKKIFIVSHGTAISFLFSKWCKLILTNPRSKIRQFYFKGKIIFDGVFNAPELFKLEFDDKKLVNIENIKINY